jgi:[ribosomal protein S5]-alanine N-acetyltransferase
MDRIVTERLVLRRAREDDLEAMHAVLSNVEATRFWSTPPHASLEETRAWLADMIASDPSESDDFLIEFGGQVIGKAGFFRLPDIGYILHPDYWGRGLAAEALEAVITDVFTHHDIPAITADIDPANTRSIRLLERLGFTRTGSAERTWFIGGRWHDSLYYALPRPTIRPEPVSSESAVQERMPFDPSKTRD